MAIAVPITLVNCTKEKIIVEVQKGNTILSGTETPTTTLGSVGDYYLRLPVYDFYGPKTAEGWGTPVSLKGSLVLRGSQALKFTLAVELLLPIKVTKATGI